MFSLQSVQLDSFYSITDPCILQVDVKLKQSKYHGSICTLCESTASASSTTFTRCLALSVPQSMRYPEVTINKPPNDRHFCTGSHQLSGTVKELRINRMILLGTTTFTCWNRSLHLYMESCVHSRCDILREQLTNHQMIVMFIQGVISYQLILLHREVFVGQLFT